MGRDDRAAQPADGDERSILTGWLAFHRDALAAKCHGLTDDQLVERAAEPSSLSLLGPVRHMAEMERAYGGWALGPKTDLEWVWGTYEDDAEHDFDCDASMVDESMRVWNAEMRKTNEALAQHPTLDESGDGNGYSVRWNLAKLVGEYARRPCEVGLQLAKTADHRQGYAMAAGANLSEVAASHSIYLSQPEAVATLIAGRNRRRGVADPPPLRASTAAPQRGRSGGHRATTGTG